jgi:hypothetical protein
LVNNVVMVVVVVVVAAAVVAAAVLRDVTPCDWASSMQWHGIKSQKIRVSKPTSAQQFESPNIPLLNNSSLQTYICSTIRVSKHTSAQQFESPNLPLLNNLSLQTYLCLTI